MKKTSSSATKRPASGIMKPNTKKIEGFDITGKGLNETKTKIMGKAEVTSKINQIKTRTATSGLEEEYIRTLQDEVKILEYQLKLLKDKEIEQQQTFGQIDKFFSDGIPINSNILALKTQYKNLKSAGEKQVSALETSLMEEQKKQQECIQEITNLESKIADLKTSTIARSDFADKLIESLRLNIFEEKEFKTQKEEQLATIYSEYKQFADENLQLIRKLEKEKIINPQKKENESNYLFSLKSTLQQKDALIKELETELDSLSSKIKLNPETKQLEQENLELEGKILRSEKEISVANAKIKETSMLLESRARDRENESAQKREIISKIELLRFKLDEANKLNELVIAQKVKEKEEFDIRETTKLLDAIRKEKESIFDRKRYEEEEIERMGNLKVTTQQDIIDMEETRDRLERASKENYEKLFETKKELERYTFRNKELDTQIPTLESELAAIKAKIPKFENAIEEIKIRLQALHKQMEFAKQVKQLNFEDIKISKNTNKEVNDTLLNFIKKFEEIQRFSSLNL